MALFFDELAAVFLARNIDRKDYDVNKPFLSWLNNLITHNFENNFVIEEVPQAPSKLNLQMVRALNAEDDLQRTSDDDTGSLIAINIGGAVLDSSAE